jgi:hypothetical protein
MRLIIIKQTVWILLARSSSYIWPTISSLVFQDFHFLMNVLAKPLIPCKCCSNYSFRLIAEDPDADARILEWTLCVGWMHLAQDMDQWLALVNAVMNLRIP